MNGKSNYSGYILLSVIFHLGIIFSVDPVINKQGVPELKIWGGLLSPGDLKCGRCIEKNELPGELFSFFSGKEYIASSIKCPDMLLGADRERIVYSRGGLDKSRGAPAPVTYTINDKNLPVIDLVDRGYSDMIYRARVSPKGRLMLLTPLNLPLNSIFNQYLENSVKERFITLGKGYFYWTRVQIVVK